jgi:hypothetical protein
VFERSFNRTDPTAKNVGITIALMSNERAQAWLEERGHGFEAEPAWVSGKRPGYFL